MLQRLIAAVLGVLGLVAIGLGVASATAWRADDVLVATSTLTADGSHLAVTAPGVLELADDSVEVTITGADDADVVLAVGRDTDVEGWVGADAHVRITGLSGWHELRTDQVAAPVPTGDPSGAASADPTEPAAEPSPSGTATDGADPDAARVDVADPTGSDLWVAQATGTGSATLQWTAQPGRWSLVAANLGAGSATVALAWPQVVTTPWLWPGVLVGALLLLAAAFLAVRLWRRHRRGDVEPDWHAVTTGMIAVVDPATPTAPLTRRQIREALAAQEEAARHRGRGGRALTGAVPVVAPPVAPEPTPDEPAAPTSTIPAVTPAADAAPADEPVADTSPTGTPPSDTPPSDGEPGPEGAPTTRRGLSLRRRADAPAPADIPVDPAPAIVPIPAAPTPAEPDADAPTEPGAHRRGLFGRRNRPAAEGQGPSPDEGGPGSASSTSPTAAPAPHDQPSGPEDDDSDDVPRPVFPPVVAAESLGPRADAWRKAWGFPTEPAEPAGPTTAASADERATDGRADHEPGPDTRQQKEEGR